MNRLYRYTQITVFWIVVFVALSFIGKKYGDVGLVMFVLMFLVLVTLISGGSEIEKKATKQRIGRRLMFSVLRK